MKPGQADIRLRNLEFPLEVSSTLPNGAAKEAVEVLGRRITNDVYEQGQTMPTEPELAESLNVSRATVRDAIKVLSGKGLVRTARRYGTRVRPLQEWTLLDADVVSWHDPNHPRIRQMFAETTEMRCIIEPAAAALAAERANDAQVSKLLESAHAMHPGAKNVQEMFTADCNFHATILDATGNMVMRQMQKIILTMLRISYEYGVLVVDGEPVSREGHIHVAQAIRDRDPATAERTMREMLQINRRTATDYWSRSDASD